MVVLVLVLVLLPLCVSADDIQSKSGWDQELLNTKLGSVNIKGQSESRIPQIIVGWQQMTTKYLLRANIYLDEASELDTTRFEFSKEKATGQDVADAFLSAYPAFTYTRDSLTRVLWFHPKSLPYADILSAKLQVMHPSLQLPMYSDVLQPLLRSLYPHSTAVVGAFWKRLLGGAGPRRENPLLQFDYGVDIPAGSYSVCDIIDLCCVCVPNLAFTVEATRDGMLWVNPVNLTYDNPLASVRIPAMELWKSEVSDTTNLPPSPAAIAVALSDLNPRKRWAAREYIRATSGLSEGKATGDLTVDVWELVGFKTVNLPGHGDTPFLRNDKNFRGTNLSITMHDLARIDPGLALVTAMEVAREGKDPAVLEVVSGHKFTEAEVAVIKPDVYRIARESKLVRDKLVEMKFDLPELSPDPLSELSNTNWFRSVAAENK